MPTSFSLTFDSTHGSLVLVAGEQIISDVTDIRITRSASGGYDCEVTRANGGAPIHLVASASTTGKLALGRANGRESPEVPGFVEVTGPAQEVLSASVREQIARGFGWKEEQS